MAKEYTADKMLRLFGPNGEHWIRGWSRKIVDGVTCYCLIGALAQCDPIGISDGRMLAEAIYHHRLDRYASPYLSISRYNDHVASGFGEIKKVLERMRDLEKAEAA